MTRDSIAARGMVLIMSKQFLAGVVTVVGGFLLSKVLGPQDFGIYVICQSLTAVLTIIGRLGVNGWLLVQKSEPTEADYRIALAVMFAASTLVSCLSFPVLPLLEQFSRIPGLFWPTVFSALMLPVYVLVIPATVRLERQLRYRPVVVIELVCQIVALAVGVSLAFHGWGVWGPLFGWLVREIINCVMSWAVVGLLPHVSRDTIRVREILQFGTKYSLAIGIGQSRNLVFLTLVGRMLGSEAVGFLGLAIKAAGLASPVRAAAARLMLPTLAPIVHTPEALRRGLKVLVETEVLLSVPVVVSAIIVYSLGVEFLLGPAWQPTVALLPWVVAASLLMSPHAPALSVLNMSSHFRESYSASALSLMALAVTVILLEGAYGVEGCAAALLIGWPASWLQEWFAREHMGTSNPTIGMLWAIGGAGICLAMRLGPWMLILPVIVVAVTYSDILCRSHALMTAIRFNGRANARF